MSKPVYVVDRIEGEIAVLLGNEEDVLEVPAETLPPGTTEGTVVEVVELEVSGEMGFHILHAETESRRASAAARIRNLGVDGPGGDLIL